MNLSQAIDCNAVGNVQPSRVVAGEKARQEQKPLPTCSNRGCHAGYSGAVHSPEAEVTNIFSNTYLAMRTDYFNELDTCEATRGLHTRQIIDGVRLDPRIGKHYNNPSFGFGGYRLPKDTTRKDFVADSILQRLPKVAGIYRLIMKAGSDDYRASSVQGIIRRLWAKGVKVVVYEPVLRENEFFHSKVVNHLPRFTQQTDVIVANRITDDIHDVTEKVYSRDLFGND